MFDQVSSVEPLLMAISTLSIPNQCGLEFAFAGPVACDNPLEGVNSGMVDQFSSHRGRTWTALRRW